MKDFDVMVKDNGKKSVVLIVDDDPLIIQSLKFVLERYYEVISESDPLKVPELLTKSVVDVVISDEIMPGMRGSELAGVINDQFPNIVKIILSGNSEKRDIVKAINRGHIFYFLFKPVDTVHLLQAVKRGLDHKMMKETIQKQNQDLEIKNKRLEEDVSKKRAKILEMEKFYERGKLSASIAHDLNSPLQALVTGFQLLEEEFLQDQGEPVDNVMKLIGSSLEKMEKLIKGISGRISSKPEDEPVMVDLNAIIEKNIDSIYLTRLKEYPFEIIFTPHENLPGIQGIPLHFEQILTNIFENSFYAVREAGRKNIFVKTLLKDKSICIFVKDEGIGIEKDHLGSIFEAGFTTKEPGRGTGLGLVITKQMVESYRGRIKVESEKNKGTSLLICFPVPEE